MITDSRTNFLYLADCLSKKYPTFFKAFEKLLIECKIDFGLIPQTKDVWAVDYMPIQINGNEFVQYTYNPSYLQSKKWLPTISDVDIICEEMGLAPLKSDIVLDGGNMVRSAHKAIMTDRIFKENPHYERKQLIKKLLELLEIDYLYFVPEQPGDFTGHADGMVRFIDEHTVVVNDYSKEKKLFRRAFELAMHNTGLDCKTLPYSVEQNKKNAQANGDYINYLQMKNCIIAPIFNIPADEAAIRKLEEIFQGQTITTIDCNEIANDGGVLNCISWNITK